MLKLVKGDLETKMKDMSEEKKKVENCFEKTGEAIGNGIRKSAKAISDLGKGIKKGLEKEESPTAT